MEILATCGMMPIDFMTMTAQEYHTRREALGSQKEVSGRLLVDIRTVQRREAGEIAITGEAVRSLNALTVLGRLVQIATSMRDGTIKQELIALADLLQQVSSSERTRFFRTN